MTNVGMINRVVRRSWLVLIAFALPIGFPDKRVERGRLDRHLANHHRHRGDLAPYTMLGVSRCRAARLAA